MKTQYTVEVRPKLNAQVVLYGEYYIESRSKSIVQEISVTILLIYFVYLDHQFLLSLFDLPVSKRYLYNCRRLFPHHNEPRFLSAGPKNSSCCQINWPIYLSYTYAKKLSPNTVPIPSCLHYIKF